MWSAVPKSSLICNKFNFPKWQTHGSSVISTIGCLHILKNGREHTGHPVCPIPWMHDWHKGMHYALGDGRQHKLNKINMHWVLHPSMHVAISTPQLTDKNSYDTPKLYATTLAFVLNMKDHPKSNQSGTVCVFLPLIWLLRWL